MYLVGLTGGIGTGKSTVSSTFKDLGVPIIDADLIARQVVEPGKPAFKEIKTEFGQEVMSPDGKVIDRDALRKLVLKDESKLHKLNAITHPHIRKQMVWEVVALTAKGYQFAILDAPLLFESGGKMLRYLHKIVVVVCEPDLQIQRLMENRDLSEHESTQLIKLQMPLAEKMEMADFVLENSGNMKDLREQVTTIHTRLIRDNFHWKIRSGIGIAFGSIIGLLYLVAKSCLKVTTTK